MRTPKTYPPGCPPGYDAQEQGLWGQLQYQMTRAGKIEDRLRVLEGIIAGLARDIRDLRWVDEHILSHTATSAPDRAEFEDRGVPSTADQVGEVLPPPAAPKRRKGGAA